jgi:hypothetical protein
MRIIILVCEFDSFGDESVESVSNSFSKLVR